MPGSLKTALRKARRSLLRAVRGGRRPGFLIVGAQKSGTTSLHQYLVQHPKISGGERKELHYFNRDMHFGKSFDQYLRDFAGPADHLYFDATPGYLYERSVPEAISKALPDARIVIILREPVARAYSAWNHFKDLFDLYIAGKDIPLIRTRPQSDDWYLFQSFYEGRKTFPSFGECLDIEQRLIQEGRGTEPALIRRGLYLDQIKRYEEFFDPSRMLILGSRELQKDPAAVMTRVGDFVGAAPFDWKKVEVQRKNSRDYAAPILPADAERLAGIYKEPNERLRQHLGRTLDW